jgi:hypothetical protein
MAEQRSIEDPLLPEELRVSIKEFWPESEWDNAASIAWLESRWDAFAVADTTSPDYPCGAIIDNRQGVMIYAERSIGYFQINSCNFLDWEPWRLYNARHNAGTAHMLWDRAGGQWTAWYFSAISLGLLQA